MSMPSQEQIDAAEKPAWVPPDVVSAALAHVPPGWNMIQRLPAGGAFLRGNMQVLFTVQRYADGRIWYHASVCGRGGPDRFYLPDWDDLKRVKRDFIGADKWAYQVFPDEKHYVNHHLCVLHLYALMKNTPALPDFTWGLGTI